MAGNQVVNQALAYEEFEPFCKWQRSEDGDILEIHLPEFKKEQLKVQISNHGILKIYGERPLGTSKHTKFYKEVAVPSNKYDTQAIHAKFLAGNLIITLPKQKTPVPEANVGKVVSSSEPSKVDQPPKSGSTTGAPDISGGPKEQTPTPGGNIASTECRFESRKRKTMGLRLDRVAVSLAATAAVVAVMVAYVVYMYKCTVPENIDDSI